jgi:hypothetical protein
MMFGDEAAGDRMLDDVHGIGAGIYRAEVGRP